MLVESLRALHLCIVDLHLISFPTSKSDKKVAIEKINVLIDPSSTLPQREHRTSSLDILDIFGCYSNFH